MSNQEYAVKMLVGNTLTSIELAQADLPQYHTEIERMKQDMYKFATPPAKLCLYTLQALEEMYEDRYVA